MCARREHEVQRERERERERERLEMETERERWTKGSHFFFLDFLEGVEDEPPVAP